MDVYYQMALAHPLEDWGYCQSHEFQNLPSRPLPDGTETINDAPGYVSAINIQGMIFSGYDHYSVVPIGDGECRAVCWIDDDEGREAYPFEQWYAREWIFRPLQPNMELGGAYTPKHSQIVYANSTIKDYYAGIGPVENTTVRDWSDFIPPSSQSIRHGVWLSDELHGEHEVRRPMRRWEQWTSGLPDEEIVDGMLRNQKLLGRWNPPDGTKTYILRDVAAVTSIHACITEDDEVEATLATATAGTVVSGNLSGGGNGFLACWSTSTDEPDVGTWPTGDYRWVANIPTQGGDISYGLRSAGVSNGHFGRVNSALSSEVDTKDMVESLFTGSGPKTATTGSVTWSGTTQSDRFEALVAGTRAANHGNQSVTFDVNTSSDIVDGPWVADPARIVGSRQGRSDQAYQPNYVGRTRRAVVPGTALTANDQVWAHRIAAIHDIPSNTVEGVTNRQRVPGAVDRIAPRRIATAEYIGHIDSQGRYVRSPLAGPAPAVFQQGLDRGATQRADANGNRRDRGAAEKNEQVVAGRLIKRVFVSQAPFDVEPELEW